MPGLVITRRLTESVRIGDAIVTVAGLRSNRCRLLIDAPESVRIDRLDGGEMPQTYEKTDWKKRALTAEARAAALEGYVMRWIEQSIPGMDEGERAAVLALLREGKVSA